MKTASSFASSLMMIALLSLVSATQSFASSGPLTSKLTFFRVDPALAQVGKGLSGSVQVDLDRREARLSLTEAPVCLTGRACPKWIRNVITVSLPFVSDETDQCGFRTLVAREDNRPVDGALRQLTIIDGSHVTCAMGIRYIATHVSYQTAAYNRLNFKEIKTSSSFEGTELLPIKK